MKQRGSVSRCGGLLGWPVGRAIGLDGSRPTPLDQPSRRMNTTQGEATEARPAPPRRHRLFQVSRCRRATAARGTRASVHIIGPQPPSFASATSTSLLAQPPRSGSPWPLRSALPGLLLLVPRSHCRRRPTTTRRSRCRWRFHHPRSSARSPRGQRRGRRTASSSPGCGRRRSRRTRRRRRAASAASSSRRGRRCSATCGATRSASGAGSRNRRTSATRPSWRRPRTCISPSRSARPPRACSCCAKVSLLVRARRVFSVPRPLAPRRSAAPARRLLCRRRQQGATTTSVASALGGSPPARLSAGTSGATGRRRHAWRGR